LGEVFDLLERHADRARVLAGGQSLLASLKLRLSEPELLVDITGNEVVNRLTPVQGARHHAAVHAAADDRGAGKNLTRRLR
jgi:CO/xanthine dehydrogenase FAD-binding subunit